MYIKLLRSKKIQLYITSWIGLDLYLTSYIGIVLNVTG